MHRRVAVLAAVLAIAASASIAPSTATAGQQGESLAPYVPTPYDVVNRMLELAGVTRDDVVYDLGCGDGRIVITAAERFGARGVGIDYDPERIAEANANAARRGVDDLVTFIHQDAMEADVSEATVVTLYLLSSSNRRLRPILTRQLRAGRAHRVARLPHGRLAAGRDPRVRGRARHRPHALPVARRRRRAAVDSTPRSSPAAGAPDPSVPEW